MIQTNDIALSLSNNPLTTIRIKHKSEYAYAKRMSVGYWIQIYRPHGWHIIDTTLSGHTTLTQSHSPNHTTTQHLSQLRTPQQLAKLPHHQPNTLYILEYDQYTPHASFQIAEATTTHPSSRILALEWKTRTIS